jgi:2-phospho-L-lactate guanylyltransferase
MRAIVPLKAPPGAKSRLEPALAPVERLALYREMAAGVLAALAACPAVSGTTVVTASEEAAALARQHGADVLMLRNEGGMNADLQAALAGIAAGAVAIVPGDLPLVRAEDFSAVAAAAQPGHVVIAPDRHDEGTNVLAFGEGARILPAFGPGSFHRHRDAAAQQDLAVSILRRPSLSFDIDTPADLAELTRRADAATVPQSLAMVS